MIGYKPLPEELDITEEIVLRNQREYTGNLVDFTDREMAI